MKAYKSYLTTKHWKEIKRECKEIGLFEKCIICGKKSRDIHHLNYKNLFNEDILKDLVPLCGKCHKMVHEKMKAQEYKDLTMYAFKQIFCTPFETSYEAKWINKKTWKLIKKGKISLEDYFINN